MLAFEGKRLAIMEELSASKTLDTSVMKQLTGGEAHISVRPAGGAETRPMLWSAKLITVFNEGCAPKFKTEDDAFTKRMIVIPHRSFFCKDDAARVTHAGEDYTFDADGGRVEALLPWHILSWLLQGLDRYWASGQLEFQAPSVCRENNRYRNKMRCNCGWTSTLMSVPESSSPSRTRFYTSKCRHGTLGKKKFVAKLKGHMQTRDVQFIEQSSRDGVHLNKFWVGRTRNRVRQQGRRAAEACSG